MLTAAEASAAAQVTAENWPGYAGCVVLVLAGVAAWLYLWRS